MYVIQIVGFKNSGKTTLSIHLLKYFKEKGFRCATIKHHGHGGEPEYPSSTDSSKTFENGAELSAVLGENTVHLQATNDVLDVKKLLVLYKELGVEIVIIEGFKQEAFGKIVRIRNDDDWNRLKHLNNIKAVITNNPSNQEFGNHLLFDSEIQLIESISDTINQFFYNH
ncbi:molybdopterin-guanine dinucleotide biosynthesis protein B [Gracilibacillus marinus]|jgi:molybdopterin-guanine dinucleotide biosynthesis adapter protein|uniref:Molybdopterin-guanine dinucleotide biosynthesis protein B n=1 Tax=Gracilibacillus marinus TaxID=630535 RepID=A0ABV8VTA3_9BACI